MTTTPTLNEYWGTLANVVPAFSPDQQRVAVALYRELAGGRPVTTDGLATALGVPAADVAGVLGRDPLRAFVFADQDGIAGFGGLAIKPMHHELRVGDRHLWTWCAWDSLFIPSILGETAQVSSPDPETREPVRLTVSPHGIEHVETGDPVVSFLSPEAGSFDRSAENVMGTFCHHVFFFESSASGERWEARHPGTFLYTLEEAFELGQRLVGKQFGAELARRTAA